MRCSHRPPPGGQRRRGGECSPGAVDVKPDLIALSTASKLVTPDTAAELAREIYGLDGEVEPLPGERSENFLIRSPERALILRISGTQEDREGVGLQIAALDHIAIQDPSLPVPREIGRAHV